MLRALAGLRGLAARRGLRVLTRGIGGLRLLAGGLVRRLRLLPWRLVLLTGRLGGLIRRLVLLARRLSGLLRRLRLLPRRLTSLTRRLRLLTPRRLGLLPILVVRPDGCVRPGCP
ncbi:hypothetical protein [Nocardia sp. bgisy134]|uniref:hypothetical protein n=1 Tax=Nocardia sp. bgisy134 TaxID=3413789 RepID=UPI003D723B68